MPIMVRCPVPRCKYYADSVEDLTQFHLGDPSKPHTRRDLVEALTYLFTPYFLKLKTADPSQPLPEFEMKLEQITKEEFLRLKKEAKA